MTFPFPVFCPSVKPVAVTPITTPSANTSDTTSYNFTVDLSAAPAGSQIVVLARAASGTAGRVVSSMTVGGVSATLDATFAVASSFNHAMGIGRAPNPGGSSVTVNVTFSAGVNSCAIEAFILENAASSPHHQNSGTSTTATISTTLNVPANGAAMAIVGFNGSSPGTVTWTGLATKQSDFTVENANNRVSTAFENIAAAATGRSISAVAASGSGFGNALLAVSYGP